MAQPEERGGMDAVIEAYKAGIDRTLLRENLRRTPDERLRRLVSLIRFAREMREAGRRLRGAGRVAETPGP